MKLKLPVYHFPREFDPNLFEMMDRPDPDPSILKEDLHHLQQINQWFGGYRTVLKELQGCFDYWKQHHPTTSYRILDLCTGSGDIPRLIVRWARNHDFTIQITAIDSNPFTFDLARKESVAYPEISFQEANVLNFQNENESYDLVMCHLALHHFSTEQAVKILKQMWQMARSSILVTDLCRNRGLIFATKYLIPFIYSNSMTRFDSHLSARRAFSNDEFQRLAFHAQIPSVEQRNYFFSRQALVVHKKSGSPG